MFSIGNLQHRLPRFFVHQKRNASFNPLDAVTIADAVIVASSVSAVWYFRRQLMHARGDLQREKLERVKVTGQYEQQSDENARLQEQLNKKSREWDPNLRGDMGEELLGACLEHAKREKLIVDFVSQPTMASGKKPDAVVKLPSGRALVVDSKAPQWEGKNEDEDSNRRHYLEKLKRTIRELKTKHYQHDVPQSLNVVWMMLPHSAYLERIYNHDGLDDHEIHDYGRQRNVKLVSPESLLSDLRLLKMIHSEQEQVLQESRVDSVELLGPKWDGFVKKHRQLGTKLQTAVHEYNNGIESLKSFDQHVRSELNGGENEQSAVDGRSFSKIIKVEPSFPDMDGEGRIQ